uniref:Epoxide hydrolase n=1 Tax=Trichuris muris TaxID=70415 RepID=A0A5S6R3E7_TRIMR
MHLTANGAVNVGIAALAVALLNYMDIWALLVDPQIPEIVDGYFGEGNYTADNETLVPFKIEVPEIVLEDLRERLNRSRIFQPLEWTIFEYGVNGDFLRLLRDYWLQEYDWRKAEGALNAFDHYVTQIEGLSIHFIHQKPPAGKYDRVYPILLVHGWPSSFFEYYKIIPMLIDPLRTEMNASSLPAFEVVVASLPGYAFSEAPRKRGCGTLATARIFAKLMERLNFNRYFCHGSHWGSIVATTMAQLFPERVIGLHLNMVFLNPFSYPKLWGKLACNIVAPILVSSADDFDTLLKVLSRFSRWIFEAGYLHLQATKPETIGAGLVDSPIGLAAYILEKYSSWTRRDYTTFSMGGLTLNFSLDELITQVMIYWVTKCAMPSVRYYKEFLMEMDHFVLLRAPVNTPTAVAAFPHEPLIYPESFIAQKHKRLVQYTEIHQGGHFGALEEAQLLASDIFKFMNFITSSDL